MKKITAISMAMALLSAGTAFAQSDCCTGACESAKQECCQQAGKFETHDFGTYKLHIYLTEDSMGDASFIIEGKDSLVTLEQPLFKVNATAFDKYLASLNKPVAERISDFHLGNTGDAQLIVPQGMTAVFKGADYSGMMAHFANQFGDAIVPFPTGETTEVAFNQPVEYAGVTFTFLPGASNDFPAANILIGKDAVYTHFAPAKAHVNTLYANSAAAIDARIAELQALLSTGAGLIVGGHGNPATPEDARFLIDYLTKAKELYAASPDAASFAAALIAAYPGLPGEAGVADFAAALYENTGK